MSRWQESAVVCDDEDDDNDDANLYLSIHPWLLFTSLTISLSLTNYHSVSPLSFAHSNILSYSLSSALF